MLIKKQIEAIPRLALPDKGEKKYAAAAAMVGDLLIVDIEGEEQRLRYANDGSNCISALYKEGKETAWSSAKPEHVLGYDWYCSTPSCNCSEDEVTLVRDFFEVSGRKTWRASRDNLLTVLSTFNESKYSEARDKRWETKAEMFRRHEAMFPAHPADLTDWCEEKGVFGGEYLFIGKSQKGKRRATCSACGKSYTITGGKHRKMTVCRRCKRPVQMIGEWYDLQLTAKASVTICHKVEGELLVRTATVMRWFSGGKKRYHIMDTCRVLYSHDRHGKPTIYSYAQRSIPYCGVDWVRGRNNDPFWYDGWIYSRNLREVFGERYYNVDMGALENAKGELRIVRLLDALKNDEAAEFLFKNGMYRLCESRRIQAFENMRSFADLLGVNPQYRQMYRELDIDYSEHVAIKWAKGFVHQEQFQALRDLMGDCWDHQRMIDLLAKDDFGRIVRYLQKQVPRIASELPKEKHPGYRAAVWLLDYWNMCQKLSVDPSEKGVRYPRELKEAHDRLLVRVNVLKAREKAKADKAKLRREKRMMADVMKTVYPRFAIPQSEKYTVVFPTEEADFVREGTSLNHCVGNGMYYRRHIEGESIILFIRKANQPDKPFFTTEIDVAEKKIRQLYGYGDCAAPREVKQFVERLVKAIKPARAVSVA